MSRLFVILFFVLSFASSSFEQKNNNPKREPAEIEKLKKDIPFRFNDSETRDSLIKISGDSIFVDISLRDEAIREIFGTPLRWDAGEFAGTAKALQIPKKPLGFTTDYEGIFTAEQVDTLNSMVSAFKHKTTNEIAVVTIDSSWTRKEKFDSSITALRNFWGIGNKSGNNGVLIGLSAGLRRIRISNGDDIVFKLPDNETKEIIDNVIIPHFKEGNYFEGVRQGLLAIMLKLQ